jgi:hypothetical protein
MKYKIELLVYYTTPVPSIVAHRVHANCNSNEKRPLLINVRNKSELVIGCSQEENDPSRPSLRSRR